MGPEIILAHEFVEFIPEELNERTLYISQAHGTAVHKCCCGCGREVVTPLSPTGWQLSIHANSVSLYPSIGSWSLPCQSHYFITKNKVVWAPRWTPRHIARGRAAEAKARDRYYGKQAPSNDEKPSAAADPGKEKQSLWRKIKDWIFGAPPG
jgi:hypothetical protein